MIKKIVFIIFHLLVVLGFSQNKSLWQGYFSYNQIKDVSQSSNEIFAASENALFSKDITTDEIKTFNSVDGLKAETISALYYSESVKKTFVGNSNGLLLIINDDDSILYKNGILTEVPVSPLIKKINHFNEYDGKIYISCDYGISVFDLTTLEFQQTYYIGPQGSFSNVTQTCVSNGFIYASTKGNSLGSGIRRANLSNPFLDDFNQWTDVSNGSDWNGITAFGTEILAIRTDNLVFKYNGTNFVQFFQSPQNNIDIRSNSNYLTITTQNHVYIYNLALQQVAHILSSQIPTIAVSFTCATVLDNTIYIGTNENGLVTAAISSPNTTQFLMPNGPIKNNIFRVKKAPSSLFALYGAYDRGYNPYSPFGLAQFPISKFQANVGWSLIPYANLFGAKSLSSIAFNPNNENQFYVSSFFSGLLKVENDVPTILYNTTNTGTNGLESLTLSTPDPTYIDIRINGPAFDKQGNIWMTNSRVSKGLKVLRANGQWQSYDFSDIISEAASESHGILAIDKNNTKWLPTLRNGLVGFNETLNNKSIVIKTGTEGNLPVTEVRCVAIDSRNQMWIGTGRGLRIISSVDSFLSETEIQTKPIIINEVFNGETLAQELFFEQFIIDIAVDGANRKWVSIVDSGVFLVSPNGQETIYHFTKDDSPLPSNIVNDIEIDGVTGEVFFATDKGLVSFKGTATRPSENLENVYAYPNPVRPEFTGTVKISGLTNKANIKITDIEGSLVYETTSEGGTIEWDTTAFGKYKVASGVYMILVAAQDGIDTIVKKVMIIR